MVVQIYTALMIGSATIVAVAQVLYATATRPHPFLDGAGAANLVSYVFTHVFTHMLHIFTSQARPFKNCLMHWFHNHELIYFCITILAQRALIIGPAEVSSCSG